MDDIELLVAQRPPVEPPSALIRARARRQLMTLIDATPSLKDSQQLFRAPRGRRRWRARVVVAGIAVAATVALVLANTGGGESNAAAAVLQHAATVAAAQSASPSSAVAYTRSVALDQVTSVDVNGQASVSSDIVTREIWIAPDGSGRIRETGSTSQADERYGPCGLYREDFSQWPTTADAVADKLRSEAEKTDRPVPVEMFVRAGDYLQETGAPPTVRATLYRVLAGIPGVVSLGTVQDHEGRSGTGVAITEHGERHELIFDPSTTQLLAEEAINVATGNVDGWTSYLETSFVDTVLPGGTPVTSTSLGPACIQTKP